MRKLLLIACLLGPVAIQPSCLNPSQQKLAYTSIGVVGTSVDAAMKTAATLYHEGKLTASQWAQISDLHAKYRLVYNAALDAVQANPQAIADPKLTGIANDLLNLITQWKQH